MSSADDERQGPAPPTPTDGAEEKVVADIARHGWHVVIVRTGVHEHEHETPGPWAEHPASQAAYEAQFTYTVGLHATFAHPEVILVGAWQHAHPFLNIVGELVREGRGFRPGDTSDEVLDDLTVRFDAVADECRIELMTWADWAAGRRPFDALQLVLPDPQGRWPEDPAYNGFPQPALR